MNLPEAPVPSDGFRFSMSRTAVMLAVPLAQLEEKTYETHHRP